MKKSIFNLALLSMLFVLGACSAEPKPEPESPTQEEINKGAFLENVTGKTAYQGDEQLGIFATEGRFFVYSSLSTLGVSGTLTFKSATSSTEAVYLDESTSKKEVTFIITTEGGTIKVGETEVVFTYEKVTDPNKVAFLSSVKSKDAHEYEEKIGNFDYKSDFVVSSDYETILGVTKTLTFESATSPTKAVYLDESTPKKEVTFTITTEGGTIKVETKEKVFTYEKVVHPNKTAFLASVKGKKAYKYEEEIGPFNTADDPFLTSSFIVSSEYKTILGVTASFLYFESATSSTEAVYYDSSSPENKVTVTLTANGGTIKGANGTEVVFTYNSVVDPNIAVFLASVEYKEAYEGEKLIGDFDNESVFFVSSEYEIILGVTGRLTFESATSSTEAVYSGNAKKQVTFTLTDNGGTIKSDKAEIVFTYGDPNKVAFLKSIENKKAYEGEEEIGSFNHTGGFFVSLSYKKILGVDSQNLDFKSATSSTEAVYSDFITPVKEVTFTLTANGGTVKGANDTEIVFTYEKVVAP